MRYRVRLSVIEPPGTNPTPTPVLPAAVRLVSRSDEVVDVRVSITTTEPGQASYEITTPTGAIVEVGFGDEAWARRMAGATRLRRISLSVDTDLSLEQLRAAADALSTAINQGGRTLVGTSVRIEPASSSSTGLGILALVLLGGAYYAAQRSGMLGSVEWSTGAHFPHFSSRSAAERWAKKKLGARPFKIMTTTGGERDVTFKVYVPKGL